MATGPDNGDRQCFFISPIGKSGSGARKMADLVLQELVRPAIEPLGLNVLRGDQDEYPGLVTTRTISLIRNADLVVVDLTGHNPNVFYEMAVAHGFRRPFVHIQERGETIPFNVHDMRVLQYDMTDLSDIDRVRGQLTRFSANALSNADSLESPISAIGQFPEPQRSDDPVAAGLVRLTKIVDELRDDFRRMFTAGHLPVGSRTDVGDAAAEIGISHISTGGLGGTDLINRLRTAQLIRIMSTSGVHLIETHTGAFKHALANGCDLRIMLSEPASDFVRDIETMEEEELRRPRPTRIDDEIESVILTLSGALHDAVDLATRQRNKNPIGSVSIAHFSTHFRCTLVLCDQTWGWLTLTLPPARSTDSPALQLSSSGSRPALNLCKNHFEVIWRGLVAAGKVRHITAP